MEINTLSGRDLSNFLTYSDPKEYFFAAQQSYGHKERIFVPSNLAVVTDDSGSTIFGIKNLERGEVTTWWMREDTKKSLVSGPIIQCGLARIRSEHMKVMVHAFGPRTYDILLNSVFNSEQVQKTAAKEHLTLELTFNPIQQLTDGIRNYESITKNIIRNSMKVRNYPVTDTKEDFLMW